MPALGTHPLATDVVFAEQFSSGGFPRLDDTGNWTIALFNGAVFDTGSLLLDGDSFARVADNLNLTYPFTIACEVRVPNTGGDVLSVTWADADYVQLSSQTANLRGKVRSGIVGADSDDNVGLTANVWTAVAFVCTSATSRQIWRAGTFGLLETTNVTPTGTAAEFFTIGALTRGGGADQSHLPNLSRIRNVIVWQGATNGAMTDTKLDQWAADPSLPYSSPGASPVLSSPTVVSTGNGIATVRVTTDTAPSGSSTLAVRTRAAAAPAWTSAEVLASPTATITSGASGARDFNLTGLINGTALRADFAQTGPSNVVSTASFTPGVAPAVTTNPSNQSVTAGSTATFTAAASGAPTPTVQWQRNGVDISGATSLSYTTPATTVSGGSANNGDVYRAGFTNALGGPVYTTGATLTVSAAGSAPSITSQPSSQTVTAPATATFSVTATGSGTLTYQWRRNGTNISGATSSSYTTPATTVSGGSANNGDVYSVVVTGDTAPPATSNNATLTVNAGSPPPPAPGFDFHTAAGCIFGAISGSLVGLSREVGVSITPLVYSLTAPYGLVVALSATATDSNGRLPRMTHASLSAGTNYRIVFVWPDNAAYTITMQATA